jgi:hypothetical protein
MTMAIEMKGLGRKPSHNEPGKLTFEPGRGCQFQGGRKSIERK